MKTLLLLIFMTLTTIVFGQLSKSMTVFRPLKPIVSDLNNDNILDTISLSSSLQDSSSFNRISFSISGFGNQTFLAKNSWTDVDSKFLLTNRNTISSNKLYLLKSKENSVILLFGYLDGAGYRENFSIINIKDNKPKMVFDRGENDVDIEVPIKLSDIDKDGRTDFVFRNLFELYEEVDSLKADIGTYSPYLVYTIDNDCKLNETLTKKYNEDNYVFAGYEYSEKIKILYPRNGGKPSVVE
jgi:hypothetical protein